MLNFNALCVTYTVKRRYAVLLKNNRIFIFSVIRNKFSELVIIVNNEVEDRLCLYFI